MIRFDIWCTQGWKPKISKPVDLKAKNRDKHTSSNMSTTRELRSSSSTEHGDKTKKGKRADTSEKERSKNARKDENKDTNDKAKCTKERIDGKNAKKKLLPEGEDSGNKKPKEEVKESSENDSTSKKNRRK